MARYIRRRLATAIPVFFGITLLVFLFLNLAPGTILDLMGSEGSASTSEQAALAAYLKLDQPLPVRYLSWLWGLLHGDLGRSFANGKEVAYLISQRVGPSILLTGTGVLLAILLAVPLGVAAAAKPRSLWDHAASAVAMVSFGVPGFFLSLVAVYLFAVVLRWLPAAGMYATGGAGSLPDLLRHLLLPVLVVCLSSMGELVKQTRSACLETLGEDFVTTARAKGVTERAVVVRHVFRGSLIPVLTTILTHIPHILGGSVVVERVFGWPGMGSLMFTAINNRDYAVAMGVTVVIAFTVLVTNLLLDLAYGLADPRVRYGEATL